MNTWNYIGTFFSVSATFAKERRTTKVEVMYMSSYDRQEFELTERSCTELATQFMQVASAIAEHRLFFETGKKVEELEDLSHEYVGTDRKLNN